MTCCFGFALAPIGARSLRRMTVRFFYFHWKLPLGFCAFHIVHSFISEAELDTIGFIRYLCLEAYKAVWMHLNVAST
jgi:hypothetical protein